MIGMKFEQGDVNALARTLAGLSNRLQREVLRNALLNVAEPMAHQIERGAPREPGAPDLAANLQYGPTRIVVESGDVSVGIGVPKGFFYDYFLEFGTSEMSARPFYRPVFDSGSSRIFDQLGREIWSALAEKGLSTARAAPSGSFL